MQLKALRERICSSLREAGRESPDLEARLLIEQQLGLAPLDFITRASEELSSIVDDETALKAIHELEARVARLREGEPCAYVLGYKAFHALTLEVTPAVLIPRPETETLVEEALKLEGVHKVADLGTGSGAIALALKHARPQWEVVATDVSFEALAVAHANARRLKLAIDFREGSWFEALREGERFDLIVANPPYIREGDPHLLSDGLNYEPQTALVSGTDGLRDIRCIAGGAGAFLQIGGTLMLEHGYDEGQAVRDILGAAGFTNVATICDLGQRDRVTRGIFSGDNYG